MPVLATRSISPYVVNNHHRNRLSCPTLTLQCVSFVPVVVGSVDDSWPSLRALYDVFFALEYNKIQIKAYIQAYSGHVDNQGNLYCTVPKTMK